MHSYGCVSVTDTNSYLCLDDCGYMPQPSVQKYSETDMVSQASGMELSGRWPVGVGETKTYFSFYFFGLDEFSPCTYIPCSKTKIQEMSC